MEPITRKQLADLYGYSSRTLARRLTGHDITLAPRKLIEAEAQLAIYARLGLPCRMQPRERQELYPLLLKYCRKQGLPEPPNW